MMSNIVITGGSTGFGKAMAQEFYNRNHNVLISGRNIRALKETRRCIQGKLGKQADVYVYQCDVRDFKQVEKLGDYAHNVFKGNGGVHHWINNAAVCEGPIRFDELELDDIHDILSTNVLGTIYGFKVAHNIGTQNIYSVSGHGSNGAKTTDFAIYGSSKAAISQLALSLADELSDANIRIIAPGIMRTDLSKKLLESEKLNRIQKFLFGILSADPQKVAKKIVPKILVAKGTGGIIRA